MSIIIQQKVKQLIYPKAHGKYKKFLGSSSKSTRADSKNIIDKKNEKLIERVGYYDIYSDLISKRLNLKNYIKNYPKDEDETSINSNKSYEKLALKKNKKLFSQKKPKIETVKYYKEDGDYINFRFFKEKELHIDIYDKKVDIESGEDDFLSDAATIDYGLKKVEKDLLRAFEIIKKENCRCLENLKRYHKYIGKSKKLNLKKNLPINK